ncbi:MAG: hypothetical protein ACWGOX_15195 [Desulforhopalus sp.]
MKKSRYKIMPSPMDLTIGAVAAVGLLSFLLLIYSDLLWRNNFRRSVPLLDNLMHARVSAAEGHIWLEEVLRGNEVVRIGVVRGFYGQAAEAMDACLEGKSAINGVPGLPLEDLELAGQLDRLKWSFKQSERIAEQRWERRGAFSAEPGAPSSLSRRRTACQCDQLALAAEHQRKDERAEKNFSSRFGSVGRRPGMFVRHPSPCRQKAKKG